MCQMPAHHFPPLILTSLAIYLSALFALNRQNKGQQQGNGKSQYSHQTPLTIPGRKSAGPTHGDSAIRAFLTGLPSANAPRATAINIFINVGLSWLALDFLVRGLILYPQADLAFSRIGFVSPTTANLLIREPDPARLPLGIYYQEAAQTDLSKWTQEGTIYTVDNSTDFTVPVTLKNLKPATPYRYSLSSSEGPKTAANGTFTTAPSPGSKEASSLSFLTSSCMKPNFPYNPLSHPLRIPGIEQMSDFIGKLPSTLRPAFMLFLGDFIYIDVPHRFGSSLSHYRSEYRRIYSSPSWSHPADNPAINLPWLHTLDDHEIANDWSKGNITPPYPAAVDPYIHYHTSINPPIPSLPFATPQNTTYFSFTHGPASFFMLDTRTYRTDPSQPNSTILGSAQLSSLLTYLSRPEPAPVRWKIIASSVPFTKNWRVGTTDTWGGFTNERQTVFEAMWRAERDLGLRIVLLSGDRHEFGAIRFPDPHLPFPRDNADFTPNTAGEGLHEFSVGPLSMFYLPIRSYRQSDNEDITIKYLPDGNTKFGLIDIESKNEELDTVTRSGKPSSVSVPSSVLTYSLYIDGDIVWKYKLAVPLPLEAGGALATAVADSRHPRLPPGKVVFDARVDEGWDVVVKGAVGRAEEVVKEVWCWGYEAFMEGLERWRRVERLD